MRLDHPERDDAHWLETIVVRKQNGGISIRTDPIGDVWDDVRPPGFVEGLPAKLQDWSVRHLPRSVVQRMLRKRVAAFAPGDSA